MQDTRRQVQSRLHSRLNHAQVEFMKRLVWQATDAVSSHRRWSKEWKAQCLPSTFWRTQNKTPAQNAKNKWIMLVSGLEWFCTSKMLYIFSLLVYSDRNFIIIIFNNNYMASYVQVCCSLLLSWCCGVQRTAMLVLRGTRDVMNWTITIPCEGVYTSFPFEAIFPWNKKIAMYRFFFVTPFFSFPESPGLATMYYFLHANASDLAGSLCGLWCGGDALAEDFLGPCKGSLAGRLQACATCDVGCPPGTTSNNRKQHIMVCGLFAWCLD